MDKKLFNEGDRVVITTLHEKLRQNKKLQKPAQIIEMRKSILPTAHFYDLNLFSGSNLEWNPHPCMGLQAMNYYDVWRCRKTTLYLIQYLKKVGG